MSELNWSLNEWPGRNQDTRTTGQEDEEETTSAVIDVSAMDPTDVV